MASGQVDVDRQIRRIFGAGTVAGLTDGELLGRFVERRDECAFEALVERHGPMVLHVCRGHLRGHHDVEDAFQATFLILARKAGSLWVRDSLSNWLFGVARRVATRAKADDARRSRHERKALEQTAGEVGHDPDQLEVGAVLYQEVDRLPETYRASIVLCYLQGMSYEAAARHLGVRESTIRGRLARARDRLRNRLGRRGVVLPAGLLVGGASWTSASAIVPSRLVETAVRSGMCIVSRKTTAAGAASASVAALTEGVLRSMLVTNLKAGAMAFLLAAGVLAAGGIPLCSPPVNAADTGVPILLAGIGPSPSEGGVAPTRAEEDAAEPRQAAPEDEGRGQDEPSPVGETKPKPWETTVRIKVHHGHAIGFGSGTVIRSTAEESLVLTCAHTFKLDDEQVQPAPRRFPHRVTVDLFDGKIQDARKAQVRYLETVTAELMDYDLDRDVGLLRIRPGRKLPASPVVPPSWRPRLRMKMITAGCSEGEDATFWETSVTNPKVRGISGNASYEAIECLHAPKQGRTGGGLFTSDHYLAGVCNFAEPIGNHGLYASAESMYRLLVRNIQALHAPMGPPESETISSPPAARMPSPARTEDEDDLEGLLQRAERQLRSGDRAGARATTDRLLRRLGSRREELQERLRHLDSLAGRSDALRQAMEAGNEPTLDGRQSAPSPRAPTSPETQALPPTTDHERRLKEVERKLDRLLREKDGR